MGYRQGQNIESLIPWGGHVQLHTFIPACNTQIQFSIIITLYMCPVGWRRLGDCVVVETVLDLWGLHIGNKILCIIYPDSNQLRKSKIPFRLSHYSLGTLPALTNPHSAPKFTQREVKLEKDNGVNVQLSLISLVTLGKLQRSYSEITSTYRWGNLDWG